MIGFNYNNFKAALKRLEEQKHAELMADLEKVKAFVERVLTLCLESNASVSRANYPGVEL